MISFSRALHLPATSLPRSLFGAALLLIPFLNIIGFIAIIGYGAQVIHTRARTLPAWNLRTLIHGSAFLLGAIILAIPFAGTYSIIAATGTTITLLLTTGLVILTLYSYLIGSAYVGFCKDYRITNIFTNNLFGRLVQPDYFIAWALALCVNAAGFLLISTFHTTITTASATSTTLFLLATIASLTINAIIGWMQLAITASLYSGVNA